MKNNSGLALAVLIVGLANALAFAWGFNLLAKTIEYQRFSSSVSAGDSRDVVALSGDRFAIIENSRISVFHIDSKGKLDRLDDVSTNYRDLEPFMSSANHYFDNPKMRLQRLEKSLSPAPTSQPMPTAR